MHQRNYTSYDVVKNLIGEIIPQGESNTDRERLENLYQYIDLINALLDDIFHVSDRADSYEDSVSKIGKTADKAIREMRMRINWNIDDTIEG